MPLPAIILICVGCALILAGLALLVVRIIRLLRAARKAGINSMTDVQIVIRKVQGLEPRIRDLQRNQAAVADSMQKLSTEAAALSYLKQELDRATGNLSGLKS
jgi:hypothetical protein